LSPGSPLVNGTLVRDVSAAIAAQLSALADEAALEIS
jgi:hypothetical protein